MMYPGIRVLNTKEEVIHNADYADGAMDTTQPQFLHPGLNLIPEKTLGRRSSDHGLVVTTEENTRWREPEKVLLLKVTPSFRRSLHSQNANQSISQSTLLIWAEHTTVKNKRAYR